MKINWKDFGLMVVLAVVLFLATLEPLLTFLVILAIPLVFYFWRNKSKILEAGVLSFIFGAIVGLIIGFSPTILPQQGDVAILYLSPFFVAGIFALLSTVIGLLVWFLIKQVKKK